MKISPAEIIAYILLFPTIVLFIIAEATSFWYIINQSDGDSFFGLWQTCNKNISSETTSCQLFDWDFTGIDFALGVWQVVISRTLLLASNVFLGFGLIFLIISLLVNQRSIPLIIEGVFYLLTALCAIVGCAIMSTYPTFQQEPLITTNKWNGFGYSFILCWVASGCVLIVSVCIISAGNRTQSSNVVIPTGS